MSEVATAYGRIASVASAPRITSRPKEVTIKKNTKTVTIKGHNLTPAQAEVYRVLASIDGGLPDHALVPLTQHVAGVRLSSSGIRSRRAELARRGLVKAKGHVTTGSGRTATVWEAR